MRISSRRSCSADGDAEDGPGNDAIQSSLGCYNRTTFPTIKEQAVSDADCSVLSLDMNTLT